MQTGRGRRIVLAVEISTNADEADLRGCLRVIRLDVHVPGNAAKPGYARSRIGLALKVAVDDHVRSLEAVWRRAVA